MSGGGTTWTRRAWRLLVPASGIVIVLVGWELVVRALHVRPIVAPAPSEVLAHLWRNPGFYAHHALVTVREALVGMAVAFALAIALGAIGAHSRIFERASLPVAALIQVTPIVAIAPAIVTMLGFGFTPKVVIVALVCFVPPFVNSIAGFRAIDPAAHELLLSVDAGRWEVFRTLRVPQAVPYLLSAAKITVGLALVGATIAEWFGSTEGLGYQVKSAQARILIDQLWGSILVLGAVGGAMVLVLVVVERRLTGWMVDPLDG